MAEEIKLSKIGELFRGNEPLLTMVFGAYCTEHNDIAQDFFNFLFEKEDVIVYSMVTENCVIQSEEGKNKKNARPDFTFYTSKGLFFAENKINDTNPHKNYNNQNLSYIVVKDKKNYEYDNVKYWKDYIENNNIIPDELKSFISAEIYKMEFPCFIEDNVKQLKSCLEKVEKVISDFSFCFNEIKESDYYGLSTRGFYIFTQRADKEFWIGYRPTINNEQPHLFIMVGENTAGNSPSFTFNYTYLIPRGFYSKNWYSFDIKTDKDEQPNDENIVNAIKELDNLISYTNNIKRFKNEQM